MNITTRKNKIAYLFKIASNGLLSLWSTSRPQRFSEDESGLNSWINDVKSKIGKDDEALLEGILKDELNPIILSSIGDWQDFSIIFPKGALLRKAWKKNGDKTFESFIEFAKKNVISNSQALLDKINSLSPSEIEPANVPSAQPATTPIPQQTITPKEEIQDKIEKSTSNAVNSSGDAWLMDISDAVRSISNANGIPEGIIFAQGALESSYGKHHIGGFNYFGMKGEGTAGSISAKTKEEFKPGEMSTIKDKFKKFNNVEEGFQSYANLLKQSSRFSYATQAFSNDPAKFAIWIWGRGYATDSKYPYKLSSISKNIAQKLGRPELAWDYDGEERRIIDTLSSMRPEDRVSKTVELLK
jgi:flagellum-specific peptidoglycan hydrolase FlgJ